MANYMAEVAKMLGVEIGEEFEIGPIGVTYVLKENGLFYVAENKKCDHILINILEGKTYVKRKPWKPKCEEIFWHIDNYKDPTLATWDDNDAYHLNFYKLGNCYQTRAEAEANRDKWISFYASDEVLEV